MKRRSTKYYRRKSLVFVQTLEKKNLVTGLQHSLCIIEQEITIDLGLAWIDRSKDRSSGYSIIIRKLFCIYTEIDSS